MTPHRQHGVKGVYYGGDWLDLEDCANRFLVDEAQCSGCHISGRCPRSVSRNAKLDDKNQVYDVLIVGAGCIGASIARELSRYQLSVLLVDAADDVSQGATKGNSGIVHAGYDDKPGSVRAKYCWPGNQMFAALDRELRFGYQRNGSLVVAFNDQDVEHLEELKNRGETNGVQRLRIIDQAELQRLEPAINKSAIAALHAPDAGNVIPYEYTIALAENAVDNGVELRLRRQVSDIHYQEGGRFSVELQCWEPKSYVTAVKRENALYRMAATATTGVLSAAIYSFWKRQSSDGDDVISQWLVLAVIGIATSVGAEVLLSSVQTLRRPNQRTPLASLVEKAGVAVGSGHVSRVPIQQMLVGGSGAPDAVKGVPTGTETVKARFIINCAGGASDQVARMIGDDSFKIKPRVGDYILLNRNQGNLATLTMFPTPDPILGKGVLVQTTLWGNLILGPTARDMHKPEARDMAAEEIEEYILSKCKNLVPSFDPKETIHSFAGARAKSDRGDWIIEPSKRNSRFFNVAGIDSPGLAGAPAIAVDVVRMLGKAGLELEKDPNFNPNRAPIITPKDGMKGLKMGPVGKYDSDGIDTKQMAANVICKCEKVTELEVVRACQRSLPIDSSQAIRKRTRAGMGHCQGDPENFNCEARVRAIIARETGVPVDQVGGRPWPATSLLPHRWIDDDEKQQLQERMDVTN